MSRKLTLLFGLTAIILAFQSTTLGQELEVQKRWNYSPPAAQTQDQDKTEQTELVELLSQMLRKMTPEEEENAKAVSRALKFIQRNQRKRIGYQPLNVYQWHTPGPDIQSQYSRVWEVQKYLTDQVQPSPYWIGVQCEPATEFGLKLDGDNHITVKGGVTITTITEDSPAQGAGLQVGDIIFVFNGNQTNDLEQLVTGIKDSQGKASKLEIVRNEERLTVELTPRLRETETQEPDESGTDLTYRTLRDALGATTIPDGAEYTVTLTKYGITGIRVKLGDQKSVTTTDKLDALPQPAQKFAKRLVDHTEKLVDVHYLPNDSVYLSYANEYQPHTRATLELTDTASGSVSDSIKKLETQVEEILKAVKELQNKD